MKTQRSLQDLSCLTQATLFNVCLTESDLDGLGFWHEPPSRAFTRHVWCRAALHRACQSRPEVAGQVGDLLDLRFVDTVCTVRALEPVEIAEIVYQWLDAPQGEVVAGWLWALCTDNRPEINALGARLCHETVNVACRSFTDPKPS